VRYSEYSSNVTISNATGARDIRHKYVGDVRNETSGRLDKQSDIETEILAEMTVTY
jgi:hypothetical protein